MEPIKISNETKLPSEFWNRAYEVGQMMIGEDISEMARLGISLDDMRMRADDHRCLCNEGSIVFIKKDEREEDGWAATKHMLRIIEESNADTFTVEIFENFSDTDLMYQEFGVRRENVRETIFREAEKIEAEFYGIPLEKLIEKLAEKDKEKETEEPEEVPEPPCRELIIPEGERYIWKSYSHNDDLISVYIPGSVKSIRWGEFSYCKNLKFVHLTEGLEEISGFNDCSSLESIHIPDSVKIIGTEAFRACKALNSISMGKNVERIESRAFEKCENLTNVSLPDSLKYIASDAFKNCKSISSISIPDSVEYIGQGAFENCTGLQEVKIGKNVKCIDDAAFKGCTSLSSVIIPENLVIGEDVFEGCSIKSSSVDISQLPKIPNPMQQLTEGYEEEICNLRSFGSVACDIEGVYIVPSGCYRITDFAFSRCSFSTIVIPEGVKYIGLAAFENCKKLRALYLPSTITDIEGNVDGLYRGDVKVYVPVGHAKLAERLSYCVHVEELLKDQMEAEIAQLRLQFQNNAAAWKKEYIESQEIWKTILVRTKNAISKGAHTLRLRFLIELKNDDHEKVVERYGETELPEEAIKALYAKMEQKVPRSKNDLGLNDHELHEVLWSASNSYIWIEYYKNIQKLYYHEEDVAWLEFLMDEPHDGVDFYASQSYYDDIYNGLYTPARDDGFVPPEPEPKPESEEIDWDDDDDDEEENYFDYYECRMHYFSWLRTHLDDLKFVADRIGCYSIQEPEDRDGNVKIYVEDIK